MFQASHSAGSLRTVFPLGGCPCRPNPLHTDSAHVWIPHLVLLDLVKTLSPKVTFCGGTSMYLFEETEFNP